MRAICLSRDKSTREQATFLDDNTHTQQGHQAVTTEIVLYCCTAVDTKLHKERDVLTIQLLTTAEASPWYALRGTLCEAGHSASVDRCCPCGSSFTRYSSDVALIKRLSFVSGQPRRCRKLLPPSYARPCSSVVGYRIESSDTSYRNIVSYRVSKDSDFSIRYDISKGG